MTGPMSDWPSRDDEPLAAERPGERVVTTIDGETITVDSVARIYWVDRCGVATLVGRYARADGEGYCVEVRR